VKKRNIDSLKHYMAQYGSAYSFQNTFMCKNARNWLGQRIS